MVVKGKLRRTDDGQRIERTLVGGILVLFNHVNFPMAGSHCKQRTA